MKVKGVTYGKFLCRGACSQNDDLAGLDVADEGQFCCTLQRLTPSKPEFYGKQIAVVS